MAKVVVVTSGKGGVGKTTTSASFSTGLAMEGKRVAVLDFDVGLRNLDLIMVCERRVVYDFVNVINNEATFPGRVIRDSQRKLKTLITELAKRKVEAVVLGCTELVLAVDVRANVIPVYDTTAIHARAAVDWMLEEEEQARAAA